MLLRFLENLLSKKLIAGAIIVLAFSQSIIAQIQSKAPIKKLPGLYTNMESLLEIEEKLYSEKKESLKSNYSNLLDVKDINQLTLDSDFINHILFYSSSKYASLGSKDKCSFYDLILANHIKDSEGPITHLIVNYKDRKDSQKTALVSRAIFLDKVAFIQCPESKKFSLYFAPQNAKKTLSTIFLKTPSTNDECLSIHKEFSTDYKTPHLCMIYKEVESIRPLEVKISSTPRSDYRRLTQLKRELRQAKVYKKSLNANSYDYLKNLCENIEKPKLFCDDFFNTSYFKKVSEKLKPSTTISPFCKELLKKEKLSDRDIKNCARILSNDNKKCQYLNKYSRGLTPKPTCNNISKALNFSRLEANFNDCPEKVGNLSIINTSRIAAHFDKEKPTKGSDCQTNSAYQFLKVNMETNDAKFWGNKLCYRDKINLVDVCEPVLFGDYEKSEQSLSFIISKIMRRTRGLAANQSCKIVEEDSYKPTLLEYKSGCWIILKSDKCYATDCSFQILKDEVPVTHISSKKGVIFPYFADKYTSQNLAQEKFLRDFYKKKTKKIFNITFLQKLFKDKPNAIIHGVGCRADLLPSFFQKRTLNECTPLPFIIDGYFEEKGSLSVVLRTAYDDLSAPRIVPWSYIFSSVKSYQAFSSINLWGLYALY